MKKFLMIVGLSYALPTCPTIFTHEQEAKIFKKIENYNLKASRFITGLHGFNFALYIAGSRLISTQWVQRHIVEYLPTYAHLPFSIGLNLSLMALIMRNFYEINKAFASNVSCNAYCASKVDPKLLDMHE